MTKRRPTQADVARLAGVSRGVVSMVLNQRSGRVPISDETRQRVVRAMEELGYAPNPVARMLARGSNRLIGVFTYEADFPYRPADFYFPFLIGIQEEAGRQDYNVLLFTGNRATGRGVYRDGANILRLADGAILMGPYPDRAELRRLAKEGYPFVFIGRREVSGCQIDWAASDYAAGSAAATRHLIELGHRRVAYAEHSPDRESSVDRLEGCRTAVSEAADAELVILPQALVADAAELLAVARQAGVTALVCESPSTLGALLQEARGVGIRVPGDLSMLCLSDCETGVGPWQQPSHLRLNRQMVAEAAVRVLIGRLSGSAAGIQHVLVPCEFLAGDTTGPPR
ncbi:MAG: LacI family transcriptional regulator [Anaerolineae bacterium]|nr:LacI family transcriptional regulator [Anaerolineae bacterium]